MKSSLPPATKAEKRRFYIIKFEIGYLIHPGTPAEAHHLLSGGRRISHLATIPLCTYCHGLIHSAKLQFREDHGTDAQLLSRTNLEVDQFESNTAGAL